MGDSTNIYELLNEGGKAKQPQAAKPKANQKAAGNAGKKEAAPVAASPAGGRGGERGRGGRGGRGGERGRGGRGGDRERGERGEGRGRGNGGRGRGGRGRSRGRGGEGGAVAEHGGDQGREHSRRQRELSMRQGDYGNPDREGRVKHPYDKFSHSSAAQKGGGKEKKGGHGARNWGGKDEVNEVPAEEKEKEDAPADAEAEGKEEEAEDEAEEEEEEKEVDYQTYLARQKQEAEDLAKLDAGPEVRKVDGGDLEGMKVLSKKDEGSDFGGAGQCKKAKKKNNCRRGEALAVQPARESQQRGDNRGKRGGKGDGSNRQKREANLVLQDEAAFPSLKQKK